MVWIYRKNGQLETPTYGKHRGRVFCVFYSLEYRLIAKKGEGTFSEVLKAQSTKNGKYLAIKCMKNHFDSIDQVNNLREIQALRRLSPHPNIVKLYEVLLYVVTYMFIYICAHLFLLSILLTECFFSLFVNCTVLYCTAACCAGLSVGFLQYI